MPARVVYVYDDVALTSAGATASAMSSEDTTLFPRNNGIQPDRKRVARTAASPGGTVTFDCDLGQARSITGFGLMNLQSDVATFPAVDIQSSASSFGSAATRASIAAGTWSTLANDWVDAIAAQNHRYWRLNFTSVPGRFSFGKLILGTGIDFGVLYSSGEFDINTPTTRLYGLNRVPIDVRVGDPARTYLYKYRASDSTARAALERLARQVVPFGIVDSLGNSAHVVLADPKSTRFSHVFGDIWDAEIAMEQLV